MLPVIGKGSELWKKLLTALVMHLNPGIQPAIYLGKFHGREVALAVDILERNHITDAQFCQASPPG